MGGKSRDISQEQTLACATATVTGINGACLLLVVAGYLPASMWGVIWTLFVVAGFAFTGKITKIQAVYGKKLQILGTYAGLLRLMEARPMQCRLLKSIKEEIGGEQRKASLSISRLSKLMNELDQRNNMFMYVILNGLFFWELRQIMRIEHGKSNMPANCLSGSTPSGRWMLLTHWQPLPIIILHMLILLCSTRLIWLPPKPASLPDARKAGAANTGSNARFILRAKALGHPLMHRDRCVRNDIDMEKRPFFIIITGATWQEKARTCVR